MESRHSECKTFEPCFRLRETKVARDAEHAAEPSKQFNATPMTSWSSQLCLKFATCTKWFQLTMEVCKSDSLITLQFGVTKIHCAEVSTVM